MERYNAFISYRHSPTDIKVAAEIQRQLERFHIPAAIRKSTGMKKISRIFRDKDELSLTDDLNDTIQTALKQSDFLIVICSPASKESFWVQKEISYFLKTHSKKQILTVIAEGEPADVLPDILTYDEMELADEQGEIETVRVPIEPLSCDYRMPFRRAKREELPRLVAPIIGCSYDDLRRRQRQYRMRRMTAAFSAAALLLFGLSVYYAWSAKQIQENLDQALINQSEYLASESRSLLASGDRLSAVLLSLQALPQSEGERPIVPSAINALSQSTYAYLAPGNEKISLDYSIAPGGRIDDFGIDSRETHLFLHFNTYHIAVWDLSHNKLTFETQFSSYISQIAFSSQDQLLILTANQLLCLSPVDGSTLWTFTPEEWDLYNSFTYAPDGKIALFNSNHILLLDDKTGTLTKTVYLSEEFSGSNIAKLIFSPDGSRMAFYSTGFADEVMIYHLEEKTLNSYSLQYGYFYQMCFDRDNSLYLAAADEAFTYFVTDSGKMYSEDTGRLLKLDASRDLVWETEISSFYASDFSSFYFADYASEGGRTPALMYCYSNLCCMFDLDTGKELSRVEFLGSIIDAQQSNIGIRCLLSNGDYAICNSSAAVVQSTPCFIMDNNAGLLRENIYILDASGKNVLIYRHNIWDEAWTQCCTLDTNYYTACDRGILFSQGDYTLCFLDSSTCRVLWQAETPVQCNGFYVVGTVHNGNTAVIVMSGADLQGEYHQVLCLVELSTGKLEHILMDDSLSYDESYLVGEKIYYLSSEYDDNFDSHYFLVCMDLSDRSVARTALVLDDFTPNVFCVSPDEATVLLWDLRGQCVIFRNGGYTCLYEAMSEDYVSYSRLLTAVWSPDNKTIAVTAKDSIDLYSPDFELLHQLSLPVTDIGAIQFYGDKLLIVSSNKLYCYGVDGTLISEMDIVGAAIPFDCSISSAGEGKISVLVDDRLNLIDTDYWQSYTTVEGCLHYAPEQQYIFTVSYLDDGTVIGYYEEYDLQELIYRAYEQLNGLDVTEEQRNRYGLSQ